MGKSLSREIKLYALAALSAFGLAMAFPPFNYGAVAFIALVPLWWSVLEAKDLREAANLGGFSGLLFYSFSLHWLIKVFGWTAGAFWCVFALALALHAVVIWTLHKRGAGEIVWTVLAAVVWVGIEYFRAEVWPLECTWLSLGYSQWLNIELLQSASVWGLYGISGLLAASNAAGVMLLKGRRMPAELMVGVIAMTLFLGDRRVDEYAVDAGREISVALVQDESFDFLKLAKKSVRPGVREADLLVWPEYSVTVQPGQEDRYRRHLAKRLQGSKSVAVVGAAIFPEEKGDRMKNFSWVLAPGGRELGRYGKLHPIPYMERYLDANPDPRAVATSLGRLGLQICYDLDFEDGARIMVRDGAEILVVTNLDPINWGRWQHAQHSGMSAVRAVESGLWLVRSASSGSSQIIDSLGRIRAELPGSSAGVLLGRARLHRGGTFYTSAGWLTAPLCLAGTAALFLLLVLEFLSAGQPSRETFRRLVPTY